MDKYYIAVLNTVYVISTIYNNVMHLYETEVFEVVNGSVDYSYALCTTRASNAYMAELRHVQTIKNMDQIVLTEILPL